MLGKIAAANIHVYSNMHKRLVLAARGEGVALSSCVKREKGKHSMSKV